MRDSKEQQEASFSADVQFKDDDTPPLPLWGLTARWVPGPANNRPEVNEQDEPTEAAGAGVKASANAGGDGDLSTCLPHPANWTRETGSPAATPPHCTISPQ